MHTRRILLAFSLAASAASVAFADLVQLDVNNASSPDRLGELTKTLSQGSYSHPDDLDIPANTSLEPKSNGSAFSYFGIITIVPKLFISTSIDVNTLSCCSLSVIILIIHYLIPNDDFYIMLLSYLYYLFL